MITCPICHQQTPGVDVHGHVQCHICKNNIQPCCQGDTCNMDILEDLGPAYDSAGFHETERNETI